MAFEELDLVVADAVIPTTHMGGTAAQTVCVSISHCTFSNSNCAVCSALNC